MLDLIDCSLGKRNVWIDTQVQVSTEEEIANLVSKYLGYKNIGISSCAYVGDDTILLFLLFDHDCAEDISLAGKDALRCYRYFVDMGISCMLNFSGSKGFHVLVELVPKTYSSKQVKDVMKFFRDILGLETIDEQTFGDKKRIFRLPWTWNTKGGWCITLDEYEGVRLDLDEILPELYEPDKTYNNYSNDEVKYYYRPCVEYLIRNRKYWEKHHKRNKFEPSEPIRLSWAGIRIWAGKTIDETLKEAYSYGWDDWDEDVVRKKLEYLYDKKWTPHSCESLEELGYCLDEIDCKWKHKRTMEILGIINGKDILI